MAITFALNVTVPCACDNDRDERALEHHYESDGTCQNVLSKNPVQHLGSSDTLIFASASSVGMCHDRQLSSTSRSQVSYIGVFVPPSLLAAAKYQDSGKPTPCKQVKVVMEASIRDSLASELLPSIHPFLLEHGKLVGIVTAAQQQQQQESSTPPNVVIIDVSNAPQHWWHDIKASVNGEPMASAPTAVLKLIPLSSITIVPAASNTADPSMVSELPTCAVCLHRIDPFRLGMPKPQNHQLCSKFCPTHVPADQHEPSDACRNQTFLRPWPLPSNCIACHVIHDRWKTYLSAALSNTHQKDDLFCHQCAMQETLWVCLTCGFVGCGRYSHRHAAQHYEDTSHPYSLELATLRIWDYASSEFVQRGDLLECPSVQRVDGHGVLRDCDVGEQQNLDRAFASSDSSLREASSRMDSMEQSRFLSLDKESPKKANMIGEEYEALLQSALEDQAQHYEGEITRLRAELTAENIDAQAMTKEEAKEIECLKADVARFRAEIDRVSRQLLDAQAQEAGYRADSQRLLREQSVATELLEKIKEESARENMEGQMQVDDLEQQIADLTANLRMRQQFSENDELSNAQIFGTTGTPTPKSGKRGKKLRRMFRK